MATMVNMAKRAGVALSTISYALNGTRSISEETRQRIFAAIDELGYQSLIGRCHMLRNCITKPSTRQHLSLVELALLAPALERQQASQRVVTAHIQAVQEERQRLARDLHDSERRYF